MDDVYRMDKICKVYEQEFGVVRHESTWQPYNGLRIHPNPQLKRTEKDWLRSIRFLNEMDMTDMRGPKHCGLCQGE